MDLTTVQMDLMYEHFLIDNKTRPKAYNDPDFDKEEGTQLERYDDPDFDKVWDSDEDEEDNSDVVAKIPPEPAVIDEEETVMDDIEDWTEVD